MPSHKILIVDDDTDWLARMRERIEGMDYEAVLSSNSTDARSKIVMNPQDYLLVFLDPSLTEAGDDREGLILLDQLRERGIYTPCAILTSHLTPELAKDLINDYDIVAVFEKGDFAKKPVRVREVLRASAEKARRRLFVNNQVTLVLENDIQVFTPVVQEDFIRRLSRILDINPSQMHILRIAPGSVLVTLEMPEEAAQHLVKMYLSRDPVLQTLYIKKVEIHPTFVLEEISEQETVAVGHHPNKSQHDREKEKMSGPIDQVAVGVLIEATEFLFGELGRRLKFWRNKKGDVAWPKAIESVPSPGTVLIKFDDLERSVKTAELRERQEDIQSGMKRIRTLKAQLRSYKDQNTRDQRPTDKATIELKIQEFSEEIERESNALQSQLESVYGE